MKEKKGERVVLKRGVSAVKKIKESARRITLFPEWIFIPTMCHTTMRTSHVPQSHYFYLPLHMSTILNLLILENLTLYGYSYDHWLGR